MGNLSNIIIYSFVTILLILSFMKDKNKTKLALKKAFMSFFSILLVLVPIFFVVGFMLTIISPEVIKDMLGENSGILGVIIASILGSMTFIPSFVAFPLGADLLEIGAGYPQVAALVTSLMGVGVIYITAESQFFGRKAMFLRNLMALLATYVVAIVVWGVM